jgi:hypothetical protein
VVIASELLARDLLQRGVLSAPFSNALPGACYYLVTTEAAAQRADIIALREWLVGQMASGDGAIRRKSSGLPAANVGLFIGLVAADDIDQILHRISGGERVAQRRQRGKGFINRDAVIIIGDGQHPLLFFIASRQVISRLLTASTACCGIYSAIGLRNIFSRFW